MKTKEKSNNWSNYGMWHKTVYIQPEFDEILNMLKSYYLRKMGSIPHHLTILETLQTAYAKDYEIKYLIDGVNSPQWINSDLLS